MKILMVCLGNICRSPLAEGVLKDKIKKAGLNWQVDSAGTGAHEVGCTPHYLSQKIAKQHGIDISDQQCRQFKKEDILHYDKVYALDIENYYDIKKISGDDWDETKVDLLMNEVYPGENVEVPDPWYGTEKNYHEVYAMIDKACDAIIEKLKNQKAKTKTEKISS
jgi:protein-tyrosine phosphatase